MRMLQYACVSRGIWDPIMLNEVCHSGKGNKVLYPQALRAYKVQRHTLIPM
ncbi:hypothetical protein HanXRQr2_Chr10g0427411 [Helianthus annuus]|uniref:Uncharacterized protein n=1 Tax=Helianthus annuus TaxID=4232 RepID=A0A251USS2_HELAN|nr:hypothetical protein HanXRQr2_Chr14g0636971 [Helianthus annuus]KAF5785330.1 hypothetical protein HanXRQr2_Chr10g0427411 [Helianthus annuus]KAJ0839784.1 hypothetical protein HanPSC8_Chr14g0610981 [Helianthus annuus]KAJ0850015.1 hypothetical protein HanPSC8_Chr13g0575701 [Helianthus annuus]KAJ0863230.1 hypothetical protein HanPSC8_Chr12g0527551 [Helianthus annuus]